MGKWKHSAFGQITQRGDDGLPLGLLGFHEGFRRCLADMEIRKHGLAFQFAAQCRVVHCFLRRIGQLAQDGLGRTFGAVATFHNMASNG